MKFTVLYSLKIHFIVYRRNQQKGEARCKNDALRAMEQVKELTCIELLHS